MKYGGATASVYAVNVVRAPDSSSTMLYLCYC